MNINGRVIIYCLVLLFTTTANATVPQGITVTGKGIVEKSPDEFQLTLFVIERGSVASKAKQRVDHKVQQVLRAIKSIGVKDNDITSTQLNIYPIYNRENNVNIDKVYMPESLTNSSGIVSVKPNKAKKNHHKSDDVTFEVSRQIQVRLRDFSGYELMLDKVTKLGVNKISPVQTSISNAEHLYQKALELAVINAKEKAHRLAKPLQVKITSVSNIEELSYRAPGKMLMMAEASQGRTGFKSYSGVNAVTAEVRVTFVISP